MKKWRLLILGGIFCVMASASLATFSWQFVGNNIYQYFNRPDPLYSARTIITGQRDETRLPGFSAALLDVAKKVSGDNTITANDVHSIVNGNIKLYVKDFTDHDRMEDIPIHDEQGTRDRSFELLINFVPKRVDALLHVLGKAPWLKGRPNILILLKITNATGASYVLTSDEDDEQGAEQREAFANSAWEAGIPIILPDPKWLQTAVVDPSNVQSLSSDKLKSLMATAHAQLSITGELKWIGGANGWSANWVMQSDGIIHRWRIDGSNFDGAFRNATRGAAQILSHHGEPSPNMN